MVKAGLTFCEHLEGGGDGRFHPAKMDKKHNQQKK